MKLFSIVTTSIYLESLLSFLELKTNFGSGALPGKILLVRIIKNDKIDA